jgi:uncharacterized Zn finger protein (UPF0148 family)
MNTQQLEIEGAIRQIWEGRTVLRYTCPICKQYLGQWDVEDGKTICWKCRKTHWPKPKVEEKKMEPRHPRLVQLKNGLYAIAID